MNKATEDMNAEKIKELRALLAKATPGPWEAFKGMFGNFHVAGPEKLNIAIMGYGKKEDDLALIVTMYEALPALLDLAERASLPLAGDVEGLCERLESRAAFWEKYWAGRGLQDPDSGPIREAAALIRHLSSRVEEEKRAKEEAEAENARLARLVYVPGQWRCAKCKFTLIQANLNANDGTVTARDQPGDKCPNCDSPLWRVTERDAGNEMIDRAEEAFNAKRAAESRSAALARALERIADTKLSADTLMAPDYEAKLLQGIAREAVADSRRARTILEAPNG